MAQNMESVMNDNEEELGCSIKQWLECVVCKEVKAEPPTFHLPCFHYVCGENCLQLIKNGTESAMCPTCKFLFSPTKVIEVNLKQENAKLRRFFMEQVVCTFCRRKAASEKYCEVCSQFLCPHCADNHMYMRITSDHELKPMEFGFAALEANSAKEGLSCKKHKEENSLFCVTCDVRLCPSCVDADAQHKGHEVREFTELLQGLREMLQNGAEQFVLYRKKADEASSELADKMRIVLGEQKITLIKGIREQMERILEALVEREMQLRKEVINRTVLKAKELNIKCAMLKTLNQQVDRSLQLIPQYLEYSDHHLFAKRKFLAEQLSHLERATAPLLEKDRYNDFVEAGWFFHVPKNPLAAAQEDISKLGTFVYTNGKTVEGKVGELVPTLGSPPKPGSLQNILLGYCKNKTRKEMKTLNLNPDFVADDGTSLRSSAGRTSSSSLNPVSNDLYMENDLSIGDRNIISMDEIMNLVPDITDSSIGSDELIGRLNREFKTNENVTSSQPEAPLEHLKVDTCHGLTVDVATGKSGIKRGRKKKTSTDSRLDVRQEEIDNEATDCFRKGRGSRTSKSASRSSKSVSVSPSRASLLNASTSPGSGIEGRQKRQIRKRKQGLCEDDGTTGSDAAKARPLRKRKKSADKAEKSVTAENIEESKDPKPSTSTTKKPRGPSKKVSVPGAKRGRKKLERVEDTEEVGEFPLVVTDTMKITEGDPNEDYCAICLDGGDAVLVCCDYCPKVFHIKCHLPALSQVPTDDCIWQCFFCTKVEELDSLPNDVRKFVSFPENVNISEVDLLYACKFLSEIFKCPGSLSVRGYFENNFKRVNNDLEPVHLNHIGRRLTMGIPSPYESIDELIQMLRKMLYQANRFYIGNAKHEELLESFEDNLRQVLTTFYPTKLDIQYVPAAGDLPIRKFK